MGGSYDELRDRLFSILSSALASAAVPSEPTEPGPPVGGPAPAEGQEPSRSSVDDLFFRLDRLEARIDDLESVLLDIKSRISSSSPVEQYVLDVLDRVQHVQTMVSDLYKKTADLPSVKDELADLKSAVESLRAELRDVVSRMRTFQGEVSQPAKSLEDSRPSGSARGSRRWEDVL